MVNTNRENELRELLNSVAAINEKYREIMQCTGESFNIFSILQLESDEVHLHSRLLAELLNPKVAHG